MTARARLAIVNAMDSLGEDLLLLSIKPEKARLGNADKIGFGLMGSELVRLAALGRITITDGRIVALDPAPTGDAELDTALTSMSSAASPPRATAWVGRPRRGITEAYLARLERAGTIRIEQARILGIRIKPLLHVTDTARVADARARLDAIALGSGTVDSAQAAYGGLARATNVDWIIYPGWDGNSARKRLDDVAKGKAGTAAVADVMPAPRDPADQPEWTQVPGDIIPDAAGDAAAAAAGQAASEAAAHAATHAAHQAATHAAVHAANHAAVHAAVHAANHAASHAAAHSAGHAGGAGAGGHGGHH